MCDRLSWTELPGGTRLGPLTTYDLFDMEQGRRLRAQYAYVPDWWGHSAIAWFFTGGTTTTIENGKMCECTDFSSPGNFPPDIAANIRAGKYLDIVAPGLLSEESYARWSCEWPELSQARAAFSQAEAAFSQAEAAFPQAEAAWRKASAAWSQAHDAWYKARAAWYKAGAAWLQAEAAFPQASAAWRKASAAWSQTRAAWYKVRTALSQAEAAWCQVYVSDLEHGSQAQRAFWSLFSDPANRAEAWR